MARVQDIDIHSGRPPLVQRPERSKTIFLTFHGIRNANVRDRETLLRLTLPIPQAANLWRLLGGELSENEELPTST